MPGLFHLGCEMIFFLKHWQGQKMTLLTLMNTTIETLAPWAVQNSFHSLLNV